MNVRLLVTTLVTLLLTLHATSATALTMKQVYDICHSSPGQCSDHPIIRAYVGGALDLLATLDERTDYLGKVYCKKPKELFDVPAIIRFMELRSEQYATDNAMLVLVRYFEEHGGCKP
jgi:hypothetical protein